MDDESKTYYEKHYSSIQRSNLQGLGSALTDASLLRSLKSLLSDQKDFLILELGAASGEFTQKALEKISFKEYHALDLHPGLANQELLNRLSKANTTLTFVEGDAENLPYETGSFDLCFSTCLLAHVSEPEKVMREALRVTKVGGHVVFMIPTDPGFANQLVKRVITYPSMRKLGISEPEYIYAQEHKHPVHNLISILKHVFSRKSMAFSYRPMFLHSWNLNLWVKVTVKK